jgi:hypothetical protein
MDFQARLLNLVAMQGYHAKEEHLLHGTVLDYRPVNTANPTANRCFEVDLWYRGQQHLGFHKPLNGINIRLARNYGHRQPEELLIHEGAAWRLAYTIGGALEDIVAACVIRDLGPQHNGVGSLCAECPGYPRSGAVLTAPGANEMGFFDSLIAQQDRHTGNTRWEPAAQKIGVWDHGYAFATRNWRHPCNASAFVTTRHNRGQQALTQAETAALHQLKSSGDLHGLDGALQDFRAARLEWRAEEMLSRGEILGLGEW